MNRLLYFDFYAERPTLFIKRQETFRTYIGFILSLLTIIFISIILIYIVFCFINDTGLTVLYDKTSKGLDHIDLDLSTNIFFYILNDKSGKLIDKKIIRSYPYLTESTSEGTKYTLLKEVSCDIDKLVKTNSEYKELINFDISSYNCLTFQNGEDVILKRRSSPFKNSYINLFITKCHNDTKNNITDCYSEEEIDDYIQHNNIYVKFFLESAAIDHHNYSHPLTKKYYQNSMNIPKDFIFSYSFFWRKIEYFTKNSIILFNHLFQSNGFMLDATIKDKDFYMKNAIFYEEKTIGRLQFLMTVEYADSYERKYNTLIDSLTLLVTGFNLMTKLCKIFNYFFTKSYKYCSIIEPLIRSSKHSTIFKDTFLNNIKVISPNPNTNNNQHPSSCSKLQLVNNKNKISGLSILKSNNKTEPLNQIEQHGSKNDDINSILNDLNNRKISGNINSLDNFMFLFSKLFNFNNKRQLYLHRIEKIIHKDLSIEYLYKEFKNIKLTLGNDLRKYEFDKKNLINDNTQFRFSINNLSSINNIN